MPKSLEGYKETRGTLEVELNGRDVTGRLVLSQIRQIVRYSCLLIAFKSSLNKVVIGLIASVCAQYYELDHLNNWIRI